MPVSRIRHSRRFIFLAVILTATGLLLFFARNPESRPAADSAGLVVSAPISAANRYDAIGDSITFGEQLGFKVDRHGRPTRTSTKFQGWPALLGYMLAEKTGERIEVFNKGHPGDRVEKSRVDRFAGLLDDESRSDRALLLIGTNDSNEFNPTPSGLGCTGWSCNDTYNGEMRSVIQGLRESGRETIYVAVLAPVWGTELDEPYVDPLNMSAAPRNARIIEYNQVIIDELLEIPGVRAGPDFFTCFLTPTVNRFSLFEDTLHPNKLGYTFMAALWRDAITGAPVVPPLVSCPSPIYILESLDPYVHGHKQNLLEEGDEYYLDESFVLTSIPRELVDGIWVTQANADKGSRDKGFLTFDTGEASVSVYVAYDPAGTPPRSTSHQFVPVTLSTDLATNDPSVNTFSIVKATGVTGQVRLGGNKSGLGSAPQQGYVVIVVP